jgi:ParB/RepB/Spo0J family partition protein
MKYELKDVPISSVKVLENIRSRTEPADLAPLMESIKQHGLLAPIGVYPEKGEYIVSWGHRRLEACRKLGWTIIPAVVLDEKLSYTDFLLKNAIENLHRQDNSPTELGRVIERLKTECEMSNGEIAVRLSMPKGTVEKFLRIYRELPESVHKDIGTRGRGQRTVVGKSSATLANRIAQMRMSRPDKAKFIEFARSEELSVNELHIIETLVRGGMTIEQAVKERENWIPKTAHIAVKKKRWEKLSQEMNWEEFVCKAIKAYDRALLV